MEKYVLAIDIGASSGRHILGSLQGGQLQIEEVYRFSNGMKEKNGHLCWDGEALFSHVLAGLKACAKQGKIPVSVGIDTWGVDFALLDEQDRLLGDLVAYRDSRTQGMDTKLEERMPFVELYAHTGIAKQPYNSIYQLMAAFAENPDYAKQAKTMLFMPCYLSFLLTGVKKNEYTIASTSGLLNAEKRAWDEEVIAAAGLPKQLFAEQPVTSATVLGGLRKEWIKELGFDTQVVLPACHDTASAFMAIPNKSDETVYLSSGTWSLLGIESDIPLTSVDSLEAGFTNEGGGNGKIRFLQNIMGLWILQEVRREWKDAFSFAEMASMAERGAAYSGLIDPMEDRFMAPASMIQEIEAALEEAGQPKPANTEELLYCIHHSLAHCYAKGIVRLESLTRKKFTAIQIFGGGCQNKTLNRLTQETSGLPVHTGPVEATAMGNLMMQCKVL